MNFATPFTNSNRCTTAQLMNAVATTVRGGAITKVVAEQALAAGAVIVSDMREAARSGQTSDILAATVETYSGVAQYVTFQLDGDNNEENVAVVKQDVLKLKQKLKSGAGEFCDALTSNSAYDADPVGSSSSDFVFNCQKVEQRSDRSGSTEDSEQAS